MSSTSKLPLWENWAGNVQCRPQAILHPKNEEEIVQILRKAQAEGRRVRVVGSGHSFTPLAQTEDYLLTLQNLQGIIESNAEERTATVWAGTTINALGKLLHSLGLAQENLGDIDKQSIAGATATGTHGTGIQFGGLSTQIQAFSLLTAKGELIHCNAQSHPDLFQAGRVSLGALGIITRVKLRLVPSYKLEYIAKKGDLHETLNRLEEYKTQHRNFEYYWFPYTKTVQLKFSNETDLPVKDSAFFKQFNQIFLENKVLGALCNLGKSLKSSYKTINRMMAMGVGSERKVNFSHLVYASVRDVRFKEMEYNIPQAYFKEVMLKIEHRMKEQQYPVFFPIECRFSKADDIWLSPSYGRDSAYFALHVFKGTEHEPYFKDMEQLFMEYDGRPHWGKMHYRSHENLITTYPKWQAFLDLRQSLDPDGLFLNPYLEQMFGLKKV
jgi:FAD-linked oxidoreductase